MRPAFVILLMFLFGNAFAQSGYGTTTVYDRGQKELPTDSTYYTLPANQFWHKMTWKDSVYRFPGFQEGRLEFANGFSPTTRLTMNYNIFLESISVMDQNNEVSLLKKFKELRFIYIGDHKFYYIPDLGYLEIVLDGKISVAKRTIMASVFETSNGFKYRITGLDVKTTTNKYTRYYWPVELYYILDPDYRMYRAGSLALPSILPELKDKIRDFVDINNINYRKHEDVLKVVKYCNEIYVESARKQETFMRIPVDSDFSRSQWKDSVYRFPAFDDVNLTYEDGSREAMPVNYNHLTGHFETISNSGDTVEMKSHKKLLLANSDNGVTFLNDQVQGPLEVVSQGKVGLGMKKRIVLQEKSFAESVSVYRIEQTWFFLNKKRAVLANARSVMSLFPSHKSEITKYISTYNPNFDSKEDLVKLLGYCSTL